MGFSGSGGLAASSSNCCCGKRRGRRRRVSHSENRSRPCPHETLGGAVAEAPAAKGWEREQSCLTTPAPQAQHRPAPGARPCAAGLVLFRLGG